MNVYKYMTSEGGIRFLSSWSLRITPPEDFNDPFELRPQVDQMFTEDFLEAQFQEVVPQMVISELTVQLTPNLGQVLNQQEINDMVTCLVMPTDADKQAQLSKKLICKIPEFSHSKLVQLETQLKLQWPVLMRQAREMAATHLPRINSLVKHGFTEQLPAMLGVLCLSRNSNQPLMWAHYADSHRGMMLEFNSEHPAFNRKRSASDEFGYLRPVSYSTVRPAITMQALDGDRIFQDFALTKADPWSYEEEIRLIWPLRFADKTVETSSGSIELFSCPSSAVVSVTLGCKASEKTLDEVRQILWSQSNTAHIVVRRAQLDETAFALNYYDV